MALNDTLRREGRFSNDPSDPGGRTDFGISEKAHPEAWKDGKVTPEEAAQIYKTEYEAFFSKVPYPLLKDQLIDYGINSGPHLATQKLQHVLHLKEDGVLGPKTLAAILVREERELVNLLVAERVRMFARLVQKRPAQLKDLFGWMNRALEFLIP